MPPVRVGIIGLGGRWRTRYEPALRSLKNRFQVCAVCDPLQRRALSLAKDLQCAAALGPVELLERDDIDAVILADPHWYGLWPLQIASRLHKPVLCGCRLDSEDASIEHFIQSDRGNKAAVVVDLLPRFAPATARLQELLATDLGPPQHVRCQLVHADKSQTRPARFAQPCSPGVLGSPGVALVDWCVSVLGAPPQSVWAASNEETRFASIYLECGPGKGIFCARRRSAGFPARLGLDVVAERGAATVRMPNVVEWSGADGTHTLTLSASASPSRLLLEHFADVVEGRCRSLAPLEEAGKALRLLRAAAESRRVGSPIRLL